MAYEASTGLGVSNQYGQRFTGNSVGVHRTTDSVNVLIVEFTGRSLGETFMPKVYIPKGALFLRYRLRVDEAFSVSGGATLAIGGTTPGTDGVVLTEAELEAIGTKTPASAGAGTWVTTSATGTTSAQLVTKALTGTVSDATIGKATLFAEYLYETLV